jgi:hypothetical protein
VRKAAPGKPLHARLAAMSDGQAADAENQEHTAIFAVLRALATVGGQDRVGTAA